jgi:para-aminobenzoate synthetase/4-amino-4-deoxychorismate lyase
VPNDLASLPSDPFVLIDDAREGGRARLYRGASGTISTRDPGEVRTCLERLRATDKHAAGFLGYDAGAALEPKLAPIAREAESGAPLLWFGLFDGVEEVDAEAVLPDPAGAWTAAVRPLIGRRPYDEAITRTLAHIYAGDIYQANLTFPAEVRTAGHPLAVYARLRARARAGYGGIVWTGEHWLLSLSPELFFTLEAGRLNARPMKGTAIRGADDAADKAAAETLAADPKQRAENLMIVDLLRNDLSRVAKPGTVKVPALFAVETYPTVHQMISEVTAELQDGLGPVDVVEAIFPCGSVTGAPKIRAMEIIDTLERRPRGPYTGSIGWISPQGDAAFNVAIRTLLLKDGEDRALMGLGSGIVADSRAGEEWRECLAKGAFVASAGKGFDLIETMRFDPRDGIPLLERHLARLKASADALGFSFDRHETRNELQAALFRLPDAQAVRLLLSPTGSIAIEARALPETPAEPVEVAVVPLPVASADFRLRHKTSDRAFYDEARRGAGTFEVLFEDADGFLTEGSFTNLFVERGDTLLTPPLARGLLPGVLRASLIEEGRAEEADLRVTDLQDGLLIGNALRGLIRAVLPPPLLP